MSDAVGAIILLIGLAVGVDYTMFYLKREREERAAGRSEEAALEAAAATSGRSVLISGITVLVAMAGMFLTVQRRLRFVRRRHDDRGRGRHARIADRAAGFALEARRQRRPPAGAVRAPPPARRRRGTGLGSDHRSRAPAPGRVGRPGRWPARRARAARLPAPHGATEHRYVSPEVPGHLQPAQSRLSGNGDRRNRRPEGAERRDAQGARGDRPAQVAGDRQRRHERANRRRRQRCEDGRGYLDPDRRRRDRLDVEPGTHGAARRDHPSDAGHPRRRRSRRNRNDGAGQGLQRPDEDGRAARVRVRAAVRVRADARDLPLDRDRGEGDRAQPALGRGGVRDPRPRLPARLGEADPRLRVHRRNRSLPADPALRDPLRALDGLPRVHPQPDPRGLRQRHDHRRRDLARDQDRPPVSSPAPRSSWSASSRSSRRCRR